MYTEENYIHIWSLTEVYKYNLKYNQPEPYIQRKTLQFINNDVEDFFILCM